jgi:hypothetical protein
MQAVSTGSGVTQSACDPNAIRMRSACGARAHRLLGLGLDSLASAHEGLDVGDALGERRDLCVLVLHARLAHPLMGFPQRAERLLIITVVINLDLSTRVEEAISGNQRQSVAINLDLSTRVDEGGERVMKGAISGNQRQLTTLT